MIDSNIVRGPKFTYPTFEKELEENSVDECIIAATKPNSHGIFMIDATSNAKLTFEEFLQKSFKVAAELQDMGCGKGTIVGVMSENRLEYSIAVFGTTLVGATITCFNPAYTVGELKHVFNITKPSVIFCSPENYYKFKQLDSSPRKFIFFNSYQMSCDALPGKKFNELIKSKKSYKPVKNKPDDLFCVLYSSGTTGLPKGVMLTHRNMVFNFKVVTEENLVEDEGTTGLCVVPMFHVFGLCLLLTSAYRNQTLIMMRKYDERLYLSSIQNYKIKHLGLVPTMITYLLKNPIVDEYDLSSLEFVVCAAAPIKAETERALKKKFNLKYVQQGYGSSESLLISQKNPRSTKEGTCGSPIPGTQMKVVHTETGETLGKYKTGEICVKGYQVMKGYMGNEKATAETVDKGGWLRTGDIGYYDEDGEFFIVDRAKELIKYKGFQVAPAELEGILLTHPSIADCAVIGIPDDVAGELPRAYVVKRFGMTITEDEIKQYIAEKVSPQKRLRGGVEFVQEIPKNPSGKILRRKLKDLWNAKYQTKSKL